MRAFDTRLPSAAAAVIVAAFAVAFGLLAASGRPLAAAAPVVVLEVEGAIGPATAAYVQRGLAEAERRGAALAVLRLDTPGGLDSAMRDIIRVILASRVPVAGWVAPGGARAASAGTYILYASHVAAMAPATNLGAATPVQLGGGAEPGEDGGESDPEGRPARDPGGGGAVPAGAAGAKAVNDASAYIRGLAELRGRNAGWAERAVRESVSLAAREAHEQRVIDLIAPDLEALLTAADGRVVAVAGERRALATAGAAVVPIEPDWRERILAVLANPNVAYLLLLVGAYGIIFELASPGTIGPGIVGAICLLLGLFALNLLPVSWAGLGLVGLGLALMAAEAFTPTFGVLGLGGAIAFAIGSLLLFDTTAPGFELSRTLVGVVTVATMLLLSFALTFAVGAQRRAVVTGGEALIGAVGEVVRWSGDEGQVRVHGERWSARAEAPLVAGQTVEIVSRDRLTLRVRARGDSQPSA